MGGGYARASSGQFKNLAPQSSRHMTFDMWPFEVVELDQSQLDACTKQLSAPKCGKIAM